MGARLKLKKVTMCLKVFLFFTNKVDPDELTQYAVFHLGLH